MANTLGEIIDSLRETPKVEKWEYKTKYITNYSQLNDLGQEGWELCGIDAGEMYIFKRKIQE